MARFCAICGAQAEDDAQKYCVSCGASLDIGPGRSSGEGADTPAPEAGAGQAPVAEEAEDLVLADEVSEVTSDRARLALVIIRGASGEGRRYEIADEGTVIGREGADLVLVDEAVSPRHARVYWDGDRLLVRDEGSYNGTFVRIHRPVALRDGDEFVAGEQFFRFVRYRPPAASEGQAQLCATPMKPWRVQLVQRLMGGREGAVIPVWDRRIRLGRTRGDATFPFDLYMSGRHCEVFEKDGQWWLQDLGSRNGTFFRLRAGGRAQVGMGDHIFAGTHLLRVDAAGAS